MIEAVDLSKRYDDGTLALDALSFTVGPGEIYCLLGAPGAGKTTTLNLFLGFTSPTAGQALVNGFDVAAGPRKARGHLAYLTADVAFYDRLTALQNLEYFARLGGRFDLGREHYAMALREVGLPERTFARKVGAFNRGMRQKLGLAAAIVKDAPALLLDAPMAGVDAQATTEMFEILEMLRDRGKAILLATDNLFHAKRVATNTGILKEGRKVSSCSREELRTQNLESLYLDYMRGGLELDERAGLY
ncbi:MAG: ABC transporter ATP-binding protein [Thermoanaerobaculia bacterium]